MIKFNLLNLVILFLPTCSFSSQISLNEINVYLNDIKTLQAEFQQRNNDNSVSHGVLFIKKPNKQITLMIFKGIVTYLEN